MEEPDPYGDWVLFPTRASDEELLSAACAAWPLALAQAKRE